MGERLASQLDMQADWCERHYTGCDCVRIYRANAERLRSYAFTATPHTDAHPEPRPPL